MLTGANAVAAPVVTVESIMEAMKTISAIKPRRIGFYSTALFPADRAIQIEDGGESLLVAGRAYWAAVKADPRIAETKVTTLTAHGIPLQGVPIINLDTNDDERRRVFAIIARKLGVQL